MQDKKRLKVVLCWHMHQPEYRDLLTGEYQQPWTYLHAIKDYVEMAQHLEAEPAARAVVNFTPILIEQLQDYASQIDAFLRNRGHISDPLLAALDMPALPVNPDQRAYLIHSCLRANEERLINRFPAYRQLADIADWLKQRPENTRYMNHQYLADLLVWYHLAWLGELQRREDPRVQQLMEKASDFSLADRRQLLQIIQEMIASVIPRYQKLHQQGKVELSFTPYAHPIMPLLLDLESARQAMPDVVLPETTQYPGGSARSHWHIEHGLQVFENAFGFRPQGCWPAEGSVSEATLSLLQDYGVRWVASGENVLRNSLSQSEDTAHSPHQPFQLDGAYPRCFFRDDALSDTIGFKYSEWHADDAVANLIHNLENIAQQHEQAEQRVVSLILDGENAWEYYPENAYYFLSALYRRLSEHPDLELTCFSDCLDTPAQKLPQLTAGSWVYGTFSTWIGDQDKNRGWDMLIDAKRAFDQQYPQLNATNQQLAERQLAVCEGSDWFWWFGDYNPANSVSDFERLYRLQLANLYQILNIEPPEYLAHSFTQGGGTPAAGGTMRQGSEN